MSRLDDGRLRGMTENQARQILLSEGHSITAVNQFLSEHTTGAWSLEELREILGNVMDERRDAAELEGYRGATRDAEIAARVSAAAWERVMEKHKESIIMKASLEWLEEGIVGDEDLPVEGEKLKFVITQIPGMELFDKSGKTFMPYRTVKALRDRFSPTYREKIQDATQELKRDDLPVSERDEYLQLLDNDPLLQQWSTILKQARAAVIFWAQWGTVASEMLEWWENDAEKGSKNPPRWVTAALKKHIADEELVKQMLLGIFNVKDSSTVVPGGFVHAGPDKGSGEVRIVPAINEGGVLTIYKSEEEAVAIQKRESRDDWIKDIGDE